MPKISSLYDKGHTASSLLRVVMMGSLTVKHFFVNFSTAKIDKKRIFLLFEVKNKNKKVENAENFSF